MKLLRITNLFFLYFCVITACTETKNQSQTNNLKAFADTYGMVRWFYPGDEIQNIDWDLLALHGVQRISQANTTEDLKATLQNLFYPIAPGVIISTDPNYDLSFIIPDDTTGMKEIAWQHYGVDLGKWSNAYTSKRTYRNTDSQSLNRLAIEIALPAAEYIGEDLTLSVNIDNKTPSSLSVYAKISLINDVPEGYINFCDFTPEYLFEHQFKKQIRVDESASNKQVIIGIYTDGSGEFHIKGFNLTASGSPIDISHKIRQNGTLYNYAYPNNSWSVATKELLFDKHSHIGDIKSIEIAEGVYTHIPLALYGDKANTYPPADNNLPNPIQPISKDEVSEQNLMLADLIVTWNVIKYFHPYLTDEVEDWDKCLSTAMDEAMTCEHYSLDPLRRMMANLNDAHFITDSPLEKKEYDFLPLRVRKEHDKIIVTHSLDSLIQPDDEIVQVGDTRAIEQYEECEKLVSGSPQYKTYIAERIWLRQYDPTPKIHLLRNGERLSVKTNSIHRQEFFSRLLLKSDIKKSRWISPDTLYINTASTSLSEIKSLLASRKKEQTVLIDIRDYSNFVLMDILPYIADKGYLRQPKAGISQVPKVYLPQSISIKDTLESIKNPSLLCNNIFITGPMNYSHDEEALDYALYCGIAKTAGEATAGCNGRINRISLPSGGSVTFTGTKVFSNLGKDGYYYGKGIPVD